MVRDRVRIRFSKKGDLRFIGHRDLVRAMERLFRRAELQLGMSQGFHPKPRMAFPSALAVGIEGDREIMELELAEHLSPDDVLTRLRLQSPPGLGIESVELLREGVKKAKVTETQYQISVPSQESDGVRQRIDRFMSEKTYPITRPRKGVQVDVRRAIQYLQLDDNSCLMMRIESTGGADASPREVLAALDLGDLERHGQRLIRTDVRIAG